jgi:monoamine oxidase
MRLLNTADTQRISPSDIADIVAETYDVAIIGAGLTGLRLAEQLTAADISTIVLEAADRPGGRVLTRQPSPGCPVDLGAEFVGPTQNRVLALAKCTGVTLEEITTAGNNLFESSQGISCYPATDAIPPVDAESLAHLMTCAVALNTAAHEHTGDDTASTQDTSVAAWIRGHETSALCAELLTFVCRSIASAEPDTVSMRHLLWQVRAAGDRDNAGSIFRIISTTDGAQKYRIAEGAGEMVRRLAYSAGCHIVGDAPVRQIDAADGIYRVRGSDFCVAAHTVVVAMSPPLAARLAYDFPLTPAVASHHRAYRIGRSIKFAALYDDAFWSDDGLSGHFNSTIGPIQSIYSRSYAQRGAALVGFVKADDAAVLAAAGDAGIQHGIDDHLVRAFGPNACLHRHLAVQNWDDSTWSGGCPCGYAPVGQRDPFGGAPGAVHQDGVYWCATESATHWRGYMDGALGAADVLFDTLAAQPAFAQ